MRIAILALLFFTTPALSQSYTSDLTKAYQKNGRDVFVTADNGIMIMFGYFNKTSVHESIARFNILAEAKKAGFKRVDFLDRGKNGRWMFDVSGETLPKCDIRNRLCV